MIIDPPSSPGYWKTVPGMLTAAAALITALGGLIAVLVHGATKAAARRSADLITIVHESTDAN